MSDLRTVIDQMGREVTLQSSPKRVLSLVPSQTEFLIDIGAELIGRTKFCIHPAIKVQSIPVIGGTKNLRINEVKKLNPDLIIGNKEENKQRDIEELEKDFPVWMSDIYSLKDAYQMMKLLSQLLGQEDKADQIIKECKSSMEMVRNSRSGRVIYLIWKDPWMAAGKNTFIDHMLSHLGFENAVSNLRYPVLTESEIKNMEVDHILFSSEPFPFKQKHIKLAKNTWPKSDCELVDGELYSWYGSRLRRWKQ